jgi:hypothetical protein
MAMSASGKTGGGLLATGLAVALAAGVLSGCGGDKDDSSTAPVVRPAATGSATATATTARPAADPFPQLTADQVLSRAETAMDKAASMSVDLRTVEDTGPFHLTSALTRSGKCAATVQVVGAELQVISLGSGSAYLKAPGDYWRAKGGKRGGQLAAVFGGKWAKLPAKASHDPALGEFCSLKTLLGEFESNSDSATTVKGDPATLDGRPVEHLIQIIGGVSMDVSVAASGTPYILKAVHGEAGKEGSGTVTFSGFDKPVAINPPPPSQTVDMNTATLPDGDHFSI